jgi:hypothetical protein
VRTAAQASLGESPALVILGTAELGNRLASPVAFTVRSAKNLSASSISTLCLVAGCGVLSFRKLAMSS